MPEDLKKLETLSYVPENHIDPELEKSYQENAVAVGMTIVPPEKCQCGCCDPLASAPPKAKEELTPVIEPETGGIKQEVASQHLEPIKTGCAVKSPNQVIIDEVERLISKANEKLLELPKILVTPAIYRSIALEEIDLFQRTTLFELRKAYE